MLLALLACGVPTAPPTPVVHPAPIDDAGRDAIYLAMVDRLRDGESSNHPTEPDNLQGWHGGDLKGVLMELDRLQALGIQQIWLTPITQSRQEPFHEWGAYHGYWPSDWREVEPRFGDWSDVEALREGLDARGMSLVLDMVYNHTEFDHPLRESHPHWFHSERPIVDWQDPEEVLTGQVHGLPDLKQSEPEVAEYLTEATLLWLEKTGASAIRVDAVRHIDPSFIRELKAAVSERYPHPVTWIGEIFEGDPVQLAETWTASDMEQVFDFPLHYALLDTVCGEADTARLAGILALDRLYSDPNNLVTFLDNHDLPRLASRCSEAGQSEEAIRLLIGLRGRNSWTWGTETGAQGTHEPENRASLSLEATNGPSADFLGEAVRFRAAHPVLRQGLSTLIYLDGDTAVWLRTLTHSAALVSYSKSARSDLQLPLWIHKLRPKASLGQALLESHSLQLQQGSAVIVLEDSEDALKAFEAESKRRKDPTLHTVTLSSETEGFVLGAGPELGNWQLDKALAIPPEGLRLSLPEGAVMRFKTLTQEGETLQWESGPNRTHWVTADPGSHSLLLTAQ